MSAFLEYVKAEFSAEDIANFHRNARAEAVDINIIRLVDAMRAHYTPAEIAAGMERAAEDLWQEVTDQ